MRGGFMQAVEDLAAHHGWAMESREIFVSALRPLPCDHPHSPLYASGCSGDHPRTHDIIY